jgi:hypothetical protein
MAIKTPKSVDDLMVDDADRASFLSAAQADDTTNVGENVEVRVEKETFHLEAGGTP